MNIDSFYIEIFKETKFLKETVLEEKLIENIKIESSCILVTKNFIGNDDDLGNLLIKSFFYVLSEKDTKPSDIILINRGIFLAIEGSEVLNALIKLSNDGVSILCCGSSLNYFKVREELAIGYISNMNDIIEVLMKSKKVITI